MGAVQAIQPTAIISAKLPIETWQRLIQMAQTRGHVRRNGRPNVSATVAEAVEVGLELLEREESRQ